MVLYLHIRIFPWIHKNHSKYFLSLSQDRRDLHESLYKYLALPFQVLPAYTKTYITGSEDPWTDWLVCVAVIASLLLSTAIIPVVCSKTSQIESGTQKSTSHCCQLIIRLWSNKAQSFLPLAWLNEMVVGRFTVLSKRVSDDNTNIAKWYPL